MELQTFCIDLGKTSFHLVGLDLRGSVAEVMPHCERAG
jgi:hypothetical protein